MKTHKIETILVPVDFSETADKALQHAVNLANKLRAKLVLIHVVEPATIATSKETFVNLSVNEKMLEITQKILKEITDKIEIEQDIEIVSVTCGGVVYDNIIRAAHLHNADLIVMGTHGISGFKEQLFGNTAYSVVNNTTIPVLTINLYSTTDTFKKIVFPFNENLLTLKKAAHVIEFSQAINASILLFGYTESDVASSYASLLLKGEELIKQFRKANINCSFSSNSGNDYAGEILKFSEKNEADLITIVSNSGHNVDNVFKMKPDKTLVNQSRIPVMSVPVESA